jgi:hypothetical protein
MPSLRAAGMRLLLSVLMLGVLWVPPVFGQDDDEFWVPGLGGNQHLPPETPWKQWIAAVLFAVGIILLAFKNPRRTHLD